MIKPISIFNLRSIKNERGVALLWALVTITVLLSITGSMAGLMIKEIQMSTSIDSSLRAYSAAESGIEHAKELIKAQGVRDDLSESRVLDGNTSYAFEISEFTSELKYTIASTGTSGNTKRRIENKVENVSASQLFTVLYSLSSVPALDGPNNYIHRLSDPLVVTDPVAHPASITQSFKQEFDLKFKDKSLSLGNSLAVGFYDGSTNKGVLLKYYNDAGTYKLGLLSNEAGSDIPTSDSSVDFTFSNNADYRVTFEYQKGSTLKLTVRKATGGVDEFGRLIYSCEEGEIFSKSIAEDYSPTFDKIVYYNNQGQVSTGTNGFIRFGDGIGGDIVQIPAMTIRVY